MKILHLTDLFAPNVGGTETYIQDLVREQHRRGHSVAILTMRKIGPASDGLEDTGYRVHRVDAGLTRFARAWESADKPYHPPVPDPLVARAISRVLERDRPDVVHAHNWIIYSYLATKSRSKPPAIWTLHDNSLSCPKKTRYYHRDDHVCPGESVPRCIVCSADQYGAVKGTAITLGLRLSNAALLGRCDVVSANAMSVMSHARVTLRGPERVALLPGFTPRDDFESDQAQNRPHFLPAEDGYILYVGVRSAIKGIPELLQAYGELSNAPPLVIVGPASSDTPTWWPPGVITVDAVPRAQVAEAWRHCAFGVVPSRWEEGFGLAVLEAGIMGKTVVASALGGLVDLVVDGTTGLLVNPHEVTGLRDAMQRLIDDPALTARLGAANEERARTYSVSKVADDFEQLAHTLIDSHS